MAENNGFVPYLHRVPWNIGMCLGKACSIVDSKRPILGYPISPDELITGKYSLQITTPVAVKTLSRARGKPHDY
jgi:hypothetical protein